MMLPEVEAIKADLQLYVFSIAFLFVGLTFFLSFFTVKVHLRQTLSFSLMAIAGGLNLFGQAKSHVYFVQDLQVLGVDISSIALYLIPVGMIYFTKETVNYRPARKKAMSYIWRAYLVHTAVMFMLDLFNVCSAAATTPVFGFVFTATLVYSLIYKKDPSCKLTDETRIIKAGLYGSAAVGVLNGYIMFSSAGQGQPIYQWGYMALVLAFMLSLIWKFKNTHALIKMQSQELQEKNDDLSKAKEEVELLNKCLEVRVQERTEQLTCSNEELQAINDDLTQTMSRLVETQSQLVQSEKISALSTLVAGIAHEINTPIAAIQSNLQLEEVLFSEIEYTNLESMMIYLQTIPSLRVSNLMATRRVADIIRDMKNFARLDESEYKVANLNDGIASTLMLLNHKMVEKNITVNKHLGDIPDIFCVPRQINQLILILLTNAIEAVSHKGQISILSECTSENIVLTIRDNGCGIPEKNLNKIFNPGFTSKGVGVGVGLGLAIAYKIVEQHQGNITVQSEVGKGTDFRISIPVKKAA